MLWLIHENRPDRVKEIREVLILILEEFHTSRLPNWCLLWDLFQYIVSCLKDCSCYLLHHVIPAFEAAFCDLLYQRLLKGQEIYLVYSGYFQKPQIFDRQVK